MAAVVGRVVGWRPRSAVSTARPDTAVARVVGWRPRPTHLVFAPEQLLLLRQRLLVLQFRPTLVPVHAAGRAGRRPAAPASAASAASATRHALATTRAAIAADHLRGERGDPLFQAGGQMWGGVMVGRNWM